MKKQWNEWAGPRLKTTKCEYKEKDRRMKLQSEYKEKDRRMKEHFINGINDHAVKTKIIKETECQRKH